MSRIVRRSAACAVAFALMAASGCGHYTPQYVPPDASRVRPVWQENEVAWRGPRKLPECPKPPPPEQREQWTEHARMVDNDGYWVGGSFMVVVVGPPLHPPIPPAPHHVAGFFLLDALSQGNGEAAAYIMAAMLVAAIVAAPGVAIGLATAHAEPETKVAKQIDEINRFNDEARAKIAECMAATGPGGPP